MSKRDLQKRTQSHYDDFPFDFLTEEDERNIDSLQPAPFYAFVEKYLKPGQLVAEIGCGHQPGVACLGQAQITANPLRARQQSGTAVI